MFLSVPSIRLRPSLSEKDRQSDVSVASVNLFSSPGRRSLDQPLPLYSSHLQYQAGHGHDHRHQLAGIHSRLELRFSQGAFEGRKTIEFQRLSTTYSALRIASPATVASTWYDLRCDTELSRAAKRADGPEYISKFGTILHTSGEPQTLHCIQHQRFQPPQRIRCPPQGFGLLFDPRDVHLRLSSIDPMLRIHNPSMSANSLPWRIFSKNTTGQLSL